MAEEKLIVDLWDVGQGNGTIVRLPDGKLILIDIGPRNSPIIDWLSDTPRRIHAVVISHNDNDHAGALPSLVKIPTLSIETIYMLLDRNKKDQAFQRLWQPVREEESKKRFIVRALTADTVIWQSGDISMRIIYPNFAENVNAINPNETCGVTCLFHRHDMKMVWAADAPMYILADHCESETPYLLDGPHHGAPVDRDELGFKQHVEAFLAERVFISVGSLNRHQHPAAKYIKHQAERGCLVTCSQLTKLCDNTHINEERPVLQSAALLGLRPARTGVPCRGCLRLIVNADGSIISDPFDQEHLNRIKSLRRPKCLCA